MKELTRNFLFMVFIIFVLLLALEIGLRILWKNPSKDYPAEMFVADKVLGYRYRPGFRGHFPNFEDISISINSKGLRDVEHNYSKTGYRILGLGDSVTFGAGVEFEKTYLRQLEHLLDAEIVKAGVNGWSFSQYRKFYEIEGYKYRPDLIMIGLTLNDLAPEKQDLPREYKSRFVEFLLSSISRMSLPQDYNEKYFEAIYHLWDNPESFFSELDNFKKNLGGTRLVIVYFPYTQQFSKIYNNSPQYKLKRFGADHNITFIDLTDVLDSSLYLPGDNVHLNAEGYAKVAVYISNQIKMQGILNQ